MSKRSYDNRSRVKKQAENREAVIRVMVEAMADGIDDISVAEIAKRSGVSRRSVYGYFPDKKARIRAIDEWIDAQQDKRPLMPTSFDDIGDYIVRSIDYMFKNETNTRALMAKGFALDVRRHRKKAHLESLREALSEKIDDPKEVQALAAFITGMVRAEAVFDLRDTYGFSVSRIQSRFKKVVELLIQDSAKNKS